MQHETEHISGYSSERSRPYEDPREQEEQNKGQVQYQTRMLVGHYPHAVQDNQ
jgi:hypothetical protein